MSKALLSSLPCQEKSPSQAQELLERGGFWPGPLQPLWGRVSGPGARGSAAVFDRRQGSASGCTLNSRPRCRPSPASARAVNPSHPGLSLPFRAHRARGDGEVAARLQHLPRLRGENPQRVHSQEIWGDPTASPFCLCRESKGFLGSVPGQEAAVTLQVDAQAEFDRLAL